MLEFIIDTLINFITFAICFIPLYLSKTNKDILEKIGASIFFAGLLLVGTGIFISGNDTLKLYIYIILAVQIINLGVELILILWSKSKGKSTILFAISAVFSIGSLAEDFKEAYFKKYYLLSI
ncbi:hypothetical protein [Listeria ivanovii]|uniref:Uncharacterized protein n=2 Tax=Listeria ivanovii TaxID=1638 RepID=A0ABS1G541_LISIV|nr:hypothetical protein [Listeria ivanovii]EFR98203.1 conserved hypothetical protein [Listeria ivanovii FSL F6-596]MBK1961983.1 hypothetical protein [Listeria ivanovii subsp. londoniensis]MBK1965976.1 hypothetical protein [Listeria ivanovii subsp. londoniensis]MBK1984329.1 hypothetical protein [Listeria ivanovii subsp. londoniensis]MBK1995391.1 hypothetical protein [Listeria ivanovii subsp. londoniensis]